MSHYKSTFRVILERFFNGLNGTVFRFDLPPSQIEMPAETGTVSDLQSLSPASERQDPDKPLCAHAFRPAAALLETLTPTVWISKQAYLNMCAYIDIAPEEVGWLGSVSRTAGGDFLIEETFLIEQQVHATETELSADSIGNLTMSLLDQGAVGLEKVNKLRFWGHSHVRMGTGASHTDESTMRRFASERIPWYVRGIFNKLGRGQFTIYLFDERCYIKDAPWAVIGDDGRPLFDLPTVDEKLRAQIAAEMQLKVKSRSFFQPPIYP